MRQYAAFKYERQLISISQLTLLYSHHQKSIPDQYIRLVAAHRHPHESCDEIGFRQYSEAVMIMRGKKNGRT